MAMSLEELLAKEGFTERKPRVSARSSFHSVSLARYQYQDQRKSKISSSAMKTDSVKSNIPTHRTKGRKANGILSRKEIMDQGPSKESIEKFQRVGNYLRDAQQLIVEDDEKVEGKLASTDTYKDIYSNDIYSPQTNENEMERRRLRNGTKLDNSNSMVHVERSYDQSKTLKLRENIEDNRNSEPSIDEAAIQAVISIFSGYIKRFLKDEDFRTSFHHNCFASLNLSALEDDTITESKVIANLEQAIEVVEKAAEERASERELKKASLQLSVITGLNSNELKDGFTSGIPNNKLSACAHMYLSVVYKLQKKDKIAAKHVLQVFCDSPFQAREILLPELWERMFLPHIFHLREWYDQEIDFLGDTPSKKRKLKVLEKVCNDIIDSGTYQFAVYYKNWLSEGVEAPSIPLIDIPSTSFARPKQDLRNYETGSSNDSFEVSNNNSISPQPMVSRKLYDAVFSQSRKPEVDELESQRESEIFPDILSSSGSSPIEEKQTLPHSHTADMYTEHIDESHDASHSADDLEDKDMWIVDQDNIPVEGHMIENSGKFSPPLVNEEEIEPSLKQMARSVLTQANIDGNPKATIFSPSTTNDGPNPNSYGNSIRLKSVVEESHTVYENFDKEFSSSIPNDFVCPLTGLVFEDPVTLETGHTYEREAITEWLYQGNKECPVSGKKLKCQFVPLTNFILKRVIDGWKSENSSKIQNEEALLVIRRLLNGFDLEERIANAKHLLSLGGLRFLVRKFQYGNLEEKSRMVTVFSYCIEVHSGCRYFIAKNITISCLVELIRSEHIKSKESVVLLLVEMMCLNRRKDINSFLNGLKDEGIVETLQSISIYLRSSPPEQKPLVAILLLHFDLLVEPQKYSVYREEAVDAIITALDDISFMDNLRASCCKALLILGGRFSSSGKIITENWILKQSGYLGNTGSISNDPGDDDLITEENYVLDKDEDSEIEEWLRRLSVSLLCDGKKSFLLCISKCLGSTNSDIVRVCLTTVAWLSSALASFSDNEFPLAAFSFLISRLIETLENCDVVEHKILASVSLFNFSKIPECKILLMTFAKEIVGPLRDLAEVTWTAKELYSIIHQKVL